MKFLPGKLPLRCLPLNDSPWTTTPRKLLPSKFTPWITNEQCFELSRFEFEPHFSEASIATGDPSIGHFVNFFQPRLELISSSTPSQLPSQTF